MRIIITCGIIGFVLLMPRQANAQFDPPVPMSFNASEAGKTIAGRVAEVLGNERSVFVRPFRTVAGSNLGLTKAISDSLAEQGFQIKVGAPVEVEGRLKPDIEGKGPHRTYSVNVTVVFPDKERRFSLQVSNEEEANAFLGETGEIRVPPDLKKSALMSRVNKQKGDPLLSRPMLQGSRIHPSPDSPYSVEVLVETDGGQYRSLTPEFDGEYVFVTLSKGDIYALGVHNASQHEAAVTIYIDGLSRYALASDKRHRNNVALVPARRSRTIKGYFRDNEKVDAFRVGSFEDSVVARLFPDSPDVGTIAVLFAAAWKQGTQPPSYEDTPRFLAKTIVDDNGRSRTVYVEHILTTYRTLATGQGPERAVRTEQVTDREIGGPRALIKIRYAE